MKPEKFNVHAGFNADLEKFGFASEDGERGLGIEIKPHQWVGITIWNGEKEQSLCLEWKCGLEFLRGVGFHSNCIDKMLSVVSMASELKEPQ